MYIINWTEGRNQFEIKINMDYDNKEDFMDYVNFLKQYYISFDGTLKVFIVKQKRIDEIMLWMNMYKKDILYTDQCIEKFKDIQKSFVPELKINRAIFNESVLKEGVVPYNFQIDGIKFLIGRNRAYLTDSPGIGKTIQSIVSSSILYLQKKVDSLFIIVRPGISYNWKKEILKFSNLFTEEDIVIIDNKNKRNVFENNVDKKIIIVSNHLFKDVILSYKKGYKFGKSAKKLRWKEYVNIKDKWQKKNPLLIVDEAHEFTNSGAVKVRALQHHIHHFDYRYFLSATPAMTKFCKWWVSINLLDEGAISLSENAFAIDISKKIGDRWGVYNVKELDEEKVEKFKKEVLSKYVLKREKSTLPEMKFKQIVKPVYLEMSELHEEIYKVFIDDEIFRLTEEYDSISLKLILSKFAYLIQVIDNPLLIKDKIVNDKLLKLLNRWNDKQDNRFDLLKDMLKDYVEEQDEKVVIMENHPLSIDQLSEKFKDYNPLVLHGQLGYNEKEKKNIQDLFNDKKNKHRVLIGNPQVMGVGTNLNEGSRRIIFNTCPNDSILTAQSLDRCHRINNTSDSIVEFLLYDHSLDILRYKRNMGWLEFNNTFLNKSLTKKELKDLLQMIG